MNTTVTLGLLADSLVEQLKDSGIPQKELETLDRFADAISLLKIHGMMSDKATESARKKLMTKIRQEFKKAIDKKPVR